MSQDAWIADVQDEMEQSTEFRVLRDMITGWLMAPDRSPFDERPPWWTNAHRQLAAMSDPARIAFEAGRRYQKALTEWQYRQ